MNRIPGITEEYDQYLIYPKDESTGAWIAKINEIISMSKDCRWRNNLDGQRFIISNKSAQKQADRILSLIRY